jgi:hypothetical protein
MIMGKELKIISASMSGYQLVVTIHYDGESHRYPSDFFAPPIDGTPLKPRTVLVLPHVIEGIADKIGASVEEVRKAVALYLG